MIVERIVIARRRIRTYIAHSEDANYVRRVFALTDVPNTAELLIEMLRKGDIDEVNNALVFLKDAANRGSVPEFRDYLPNSGLYAALADGMDDHRMAIRNNCVVTLGRIGALEQVPAMVAALPKYLERDPLLVPALIREICWLTRSAQRWRYVDRAAACPLYLTRWASLEAAGSVASGPRSNKRLLTFYTAMTADPHPFVRAEASEQLVELERARIVRTSSRKKQMTEVPASELPVPDYSFFGLTALFRNCLSFTGRDDYSVELLDHFAHYERAHPFDRTKIEVQAYAQKFFATETGTPTS